MHVLVLGANSDMALALARRFAEVEGTELTLASRDMELLEKRARDLELRHGVRARAVSFDARDTDGHREFLRGLHAPVDVAVLAFGVLGDQEKAQRDFAEARRILDTNLVGAASVLELLAEDMEARKSGSIIGFASVAGLRGRASNYAYGAAKAGFIAWLSGLRNRLHGSGVRVLTVLPGFVRPRMTEGLPLPAPLCATPEQAADDVFRAWKRGAPVVYTRWFWRYIMWIIRLLPEAVFQRTRL